MNQEKISTLQKQIEDIKRRWPAHSVPPAMMAQLDELEEQLIDEMKKSTHLAETISDTIHMRPIGYVESPFDEPADPDTIRSGESRIVLDPSLVEGLIGLEPGQQIVVLFCFHRSDGFELLQHPRGDRNRPERGVFALRSPRRPNPIGMTEVEIIEISDNTLRVRGLDAINGSPVLDIKIAR